jgi:hypothetical protein
MRRIEYTHGQIINGIKFIREAEQQKKQRMGVFCCKCGNEFTAAIRKIKSGHTKSCGCRKMQLMIGNQLNKKHGLRNHPNYQRWKHMKFRCYNSNHPAYKYYGARGIIVCDEWINNYVVYHNYIMSLENAMSPKLSIDRIDNDGNYKPGNLRWATASEQLKNRRAVRLNEN